jgi:peptide/nickel transport system permease protein
MGGYIVRRLFQAVLTIFGVLLLTFLLFRVGAGDIAAAHLGAKADEQQKKQWAEKYGYDKPLILGWKDGESVFDTQFVHHLTATVTFQSESLVHRRKLLDIIIRRAPMSLAITVPALALSWTLAMVVSTIVAYWRASLIDHVGVFLSVLGMCIPYLAFILFVQQFLFRWRPEMAYGLGNPLNIFVPVGIAVIAGMGGNVRFYRTVILDETNRDYVRTALAKGVPLPLVMFKHILRNCMLPILTNLIISIPFLIMGSLLLENFFGIPGLGDLILSSINSRDEPIITGITYITAVAIVLGNLATDVCYAIFDPRVRLT